MGTLIFFLVGMAGFLLMGYAGARYLQKPDRTAHGFAMIVSVGIALTFVVSMLAPSVVLGGPSRTLVVFAFVVSILNGLLAYGLIRLIWRHK